MDRPDPERIRGVSIRTLMAPAGVVALLVGVVGIGLSSAGGRDVTPDPSVSSAPTLVVSPTAADMPTASPSSTPSAAEDARPPWVLDLAGELECDGPPADFGMDVPARIGPFDPGATPDKALDNIRFAYWNLPVSGFDEALVEGDWARHRYAVDGRTKAIAVSTNRFVGVPTETSWEVVGLRACDPSEFEGQPRADGWQGLAERGRCSSSNGRHHVIPRRRSLRMGDNRLPHVRPPTVPPRPKACAQGVLGHRLRRHVPPACRRRGRRVSHRAMAPLHDPVRSRGLRPND